MVELEDGLITPLLPVLLTDWVDSLNWPLRLPSELVNGGPVDVLLFKIGSEVMIGGPVDVLLFRAGREVTPGGIIPLSPVERRTAVLL